jgi:predicted RNA-binding protein with PIN domain
LKRGHFGALEIIFTAKGESADAYLVELFDQLQKPEEAIAVTSDRELKHSARARKIHTLSCEDFLSSLHKKAQKKKKKATAPIPKQEEKTTPKRVGRKLKEKELPPLDDLAAWEEIFLQCLQENKKAPSF